MNYAFLPDLSALAILIAILLVLRRRHPQQRSDLWLLGLFITLVEAVAHTFYARNGIPAKALHVIVLDCYLLAGLVFTWASGEQIDDRRARMLNLGINVLPLFALNTIYGLNLRVRAPYVPVLVAGVLLSLGAALLVRRSWRQALLVVSGWMILGYLVETNHFRHAVYWGIACIYGIAAANFYRRLPRHSTGRLAILTGFSIWSLCFMLHPFIVNHRDIAEIFSHVWNMQKSLISIGMILVMLEEQVSSNEWLALHDELTGLPNRRLFADRLQSAIERAKRSSAPLALVLLDLNGFKKINDTLGHPAGDQVLREVAASLRRSMRATDTLARLGGDEFIIVASDIYEPQALEQLTHTIRTAVERPIPVEGETLHVTASMGTAMYPADAEDAIRLVRLADQRMYALKHHPTAVPYRRTGELHQSQTVA
ncbi:MAG: GGDEF domain-containing protein [Acidobacteriota bacterium]|nr:GGDEF domain-containing protein [Acidobacteriota bacterium]